MFSKFCWKIKIHKFILACQKSFRLTVEAARPKHLNPLTMIAKSDYFRYTIWHCKLSQKLICSVLLVSLLSGNAFISGAGGLWFKSRAAQIGHSVANCSPPQRHFERNCVFRRGNYAEMGPANWFVTHFGVNLVSIMKDLICSVFILAPSRLALSLNFIRK